MLHDGDEADYFMLGFKRTIKNILGALKIFRAPFCLAKHLTQANAFGILECVLSKGNKYNNEVALGDLPDFFVFHFSFFI